MKIDWNMISAWAAIITALAAIVALLWQNKLARASTNLEFLWRLEDKFNYEERMLRARRDFSASIINNSPSNEIEDILDFFETIAILVIRRSLDKKMVYWYFYYWIIRYWLISEKYVSIKRKQLGDEDLWTGTEILVKRMIKYEAKQRNKSKKKIILPSKQELRRFLVEESQII